MCFSSFGSLGNSINDINVNGPADLMSIRQGSHSANLSNLVSYIQKFSYQFQIFDFFNL